MYRSELLSIGSPHLLTLLTQIVLIFLWNLFCVCWTELNHINALNIYGRR